ncbi:jg20526 [Pararge aegeria aegeria]|uniref:Jg20526 protein n=1 Tax=Pararge aegeria aegeria TaxID=348720 RepID=A0A8S4SBP6_9NEOP|nr:jg20526 [Pararge aegeria aegeria]
METINLKRSVIQRKVSFFGHLQRGSLFEFLRLILEGKITRKKVPGRPRKKWFDEIREWTGHTYSELKKMARHRTIFHRLTSELQYEDVLPNDDDESLRLRGHTSTQSIVLALFCISAGF